MVGMFRSLQFLTTPVFRAAAIVALVWPLAFVPPAAGQLTDTYQQLDLFGRIFERILADYVDQKGDAELIEAAIGGMLRTLDPNSIYYTPDDLKAMQQGITGLFGGLGMEVTMGEDGVLRVVTPIDDAPAVRAGILAGDQIRFIDDAPVEGLTLEEAVGRMRGEPGTKVTLTVLREGVAEPITFELERAVIQSPQARAQIFGTVAYVRLTVFGPQTDEQLSEAIVETLAEIGSERVTGLILDLRNNGGGTLETGINVTDALLDRGEIVSIRGRDAGNSARYFAEAGDLAADLPIIVLINGGSASASEIVAGALQDHRRATIVGSQSFGKGTVQTIFELGPELGAIRLTTALYYTPSGRSIQGVGITPDILVEQPLPQRVAEATPPQEIPRDEEGNIIADFDFIAADVEDDAQLQFALRLFAGEEVHPAFPATAELGPP